MLRISQAACYLGVASSTLRRWERIEYLIPKRTLGNHRRYSLPQLDTVYDKVSAAINSPKTHILPGTICYARVSGHKQQEKGDLERQVARLRAFAVSDFGIEPLIIRDVGSGLNPARHGIKKLLRHVASGGVSRIYITYQDRLTRFGFPFIQAFCDLFNVPIIETTDMKEKSVQQRLVDDMMALIACFSGRLYGMRSIKQRRALSRQRREEAAIHSTLARIENSTITQTLQNILK